MKEIIANSPKHGNKIILVDDEDYHLLSRLKWCIVKDNKHLLCPIYNWVWYQEWQETKKAIINASTNTWSDIIKR